MRDRNDMHRNLSRGFDDGILYRVQETGSSIQVLVLGDSLPKEEELEKNGFSVSGSSDLSSLPGSYREGSVFRFNLLASPSKKVKAGAKNSRRIFLRQPEDRLIWLARQAEKYGFELLSCNERYSLERIQVGRATGTFRLSASEFAGVLRIRDAELFWKAFRDGIGAEKAYGMGMLLLSV